MQPISITDEEVVEMILFPVVNEACRVLDDGVVVRASDLDTASILGMSFPSYRSVIYPDLLLASLRWIVILLLHYSVFLWSYLNY